MKIKCRRGSAAPPAEGEERTTIKATIPQVYASFAAACYHLFIGLSLAYSAILLPQLFKEQGKKINNFIPINKEKASWIAGAVPIATIPSSLIAAALIDVLGRLNLIRVAVIPMVAGWVVIALSDSYEMLIIGRVLTGIPQPWATSAGAAYIAEIACPRLRGSLASYNSLCISFGIVFGYIFGKFMTWREAAWVCAFISVSPIILLLCVPESFPYLLMKGREEKSMKSLKWIHKFQDDVYIEKQFAATRDKINANKQAQLEGEGSWFAKKSKKFFSATCVKPLLIVVGVFFFQNFAGIFITLFYAVEFLRDIGTNIDPNLGSIAIGGARAVVSVANIWLLKRFKRRHLLLFSTLGMSVSMAISGMFSSWIHSGITSHKWVPVVGIVSYIMFSMVGLLPLAFIFAAELFPLEVRGIGQSVTLCLSYMAMFAAIKLYYSMLTFFGGVAGLQYYFSAMSIIAFVYSFIFVPESHNKTLLEIEEYFTHNTCYISLCKKKDDSQ